MSEKLTLLYVDDEPTNVLLFKYNFKTKFNVITAPSGLKGLEELRANPEINFVISDMKMPLMNGIEFITLAKSEFPGIKYFIVTGLDITLEIENALNTDLIDKYFRKPFRIEEIEASLI